MIAGNALFDREVAANAGWKFVEVSGSRLIDTATEVVAATDKRRNVVGSERELGFVEFSLWPHEDDFYRLQLMATDKYKILLGDLYDVSSGVETKAGALPKLAEGDSEPIVSGNVSAKSCKELVKWVRECGKRVNYWVGVSPEGDVAAWPSVGGRPWLGDVLGRPRKIMCRNLFSQLKAVKSTQILSVGNLGGSKRLMLAVSPECHMGVLSPVKVGAEGLFLGGLYALMSRGRDVRLFDVDSWG